MDKNKRVTSLGLDLGSSKVKLQFNKKLSQNQEHQRRQTIRVDVLLQRPNEMNNFCDLLGANGYNYTVEPSGQVVMDTADSGVWLENNTQEMTLKAIQENRDDNIAEALSQSLTINGVG